MRLLLDTHVFLWHLSGAKALSLELREAIQDPSNTVFLSPVSIWEALVKYRLGKLPLPASPEVYLPEQRRRHRLASLPLDEPSVARLTSLPDLHRDPFDRMLVCQALQHRLTLATVDPAIRAYSVPVL
ncbi:type II toxin-antitoxin system VapC family toxin [Halochromatium salexigens]|uniref:PIN domain nuclease n=1 Tax=Halochromatium salexigens TaxID=49447 RepID=A0AAJ0UDJ3_HALSE|nr:type II toxin-antitoxin system VapC family toxin [Halochromatium salexigens]MBK5929486.1 PIN domain nuclease [Halochromatium salexigens]